MVDPFKAISDDCPQSEPATPSRPLTDAERAEWVRLDAEAGAVQFHCTACAEIVSISDYDQANRDGWRLYMIETQGWIETPDGLVCDNCADHPDDATTH